MPKRIRRSAATRSKVPKLDVKPDPDVEMGMSDAIDPQVKPEFPANPKVDDKLELAAPGLQIKPELDIKSELDAGLEQETKFELGVKPETVVEPPIEDIEQCAGPPHWETYIERIKAMRALKPSPVDTMGCERIGARQNDLIPPETVRFQHLVALMLSSQTRDEITSAAVERLRAQLKPTLTPQALLDIDESELADLLNPVGFYRRKAGYLKKAAAICLEKYNGDVPKTIEEIVQIPGVGPKMGHLLLQSAWNQVDGIGVDVHIHRLAQKWNWVPKTAHPTPEKTRVELEKWLPRGMWKEINPLLVGFGQTWCPAKTLPKHCEQCQLNDICPGSNIK